MQHEHQLALAEAQHAPDLAQAKAEQLALGRRAGWPSPSPPAVPEPSPAWAPAATGASETAAPGSTRTRG